MGASISQKSLASQFDLPCRLACLVTTLGHTDGTAFSQLDLLFDIGVCAWAVVWDGDACEGTGTEVVGAVGWNEATWVSDRNVVASGTKPAKLEADKTYIEPTCSGSGCCHWGHSEGLGCALVARRLQTCARRS